MPFTTNKSVRIHWDEQGQGTPLLLIMGHRYSAAMWYPVIPVLAKQHRVIWFDNRGTGQTDNARGFSVSDMADDALAVMDAAGVDKAHVYGVSMGGGVALELAIRHPERVRSLIPGCTAILTADKPRTKAWMRALYFLPPFVLNRLMRRPGGDHGYGSAAPLDRVAKDQGMVANDRFVVSGVHAQATAIANYTNTLEAVRALTMPALVLHGDEDALVPYAWGEELARTLPNAKLVTFKGAGHNFIVAGGDKANTVVAEFLREVDAARCLVPDFDGLDRP